MGHFYLVTWNAQGGIIKDIEKKQVLQDIVKKYQDSNVIFAIQEAGPEPILYSSLGGTKYKTFWQPPKDAENDRCTLGFLVPDHLKCDFYFIKSNWSRDIACCQLADLGIRIACIHAVAHQQVAVENVKEALDSLTAFNLPFILAGDMNSLPQAYMHGEISPSIRLVHCGEATQQRGNELDYFFVHDAIEIREVVLEEVGPSDHNPVILEVTF